MRKNELKSWYIPVSIAAIVFYIFFSPREKINPELAMETGDYYFNGGAYDLDLAEKAYKEAVAGDRKIVLGHYQLARIYFVQKKYDLAREEINKELEADPGNLRSLYVRGLINAYDGDLKSAEEDFRRFTLWAPKEWAGYNDLAWILQKERKYNEAVAAIKTAFREVYKGEENPWLQNNIGVAYLNAGDYKNAKTAFQKALALAEDLSEESWARAYPGNSKESAPGGISEFKRSIQKNIETANDVDNRQ